MNPGSHVVSALSLLVVHCLAFSGTQRVYLKKEPAWQEPGTFDVTVGVFSEYEDAFAGLWVLEFKGERAEKKVIFQIVHKPSQSSARRWTYNTRVKLPETARNDEGPRRTFMLCVWVSDVPSSDLADTDSEFSDMVADSVWFFASARRCYPMRDPWHQQYDSTLLQRSNWPSLRSLSWIGGLRRRNVLRQICGKHEGN